MITNKRTRLIRSLLVIVAISCISEQVYSATSTEPLLPLPDKVQLNPAKVSLGRQLFYDERLSGNQISCASCHQLEQGGDSGNQTDVSHGHSAFTINTPGIFNTRYNFRQNWDGAERTLEEHFRHIFNKGAPFNNDLKTVVSQLKQDRTLNNAFLKVYKQGLTVDNLVESMVEFEKSLVTPNSRFDQYLKGNTSILSDSELQGYHLFKELGCVACHQGINIGGNLFQKFGVFYDYIAQRGNVTNADYGRINITGRDMDKYVFKVPSLRNIAVTAPYLHDGSAKTLEEAIFLVGKTQLGRNLEAREIYLLKQFLLTLTGEYNSEILTDKQE